MTCIINIVIFCLENCSNPIFVMFNIFGTSIRETTNPEEPPERIFTDINYDNTAALSLIKHIDTWRVFVVILVANRR